MSPQEKIYNEIFKIAANLGYDTFDFLPAEDVSYPFVFIGEQFQQQQRTKHYIYGDVQQRVHIYHDYKQRREFNQMLEMLKYKIRQLNRIKGTPVHVRDMNVQVLIDNSTPDNLLHGILEIDMTFY